ncbi:MAG: DUF1501 domain-containing protein [Planctomycetaceae bacterium]
MSPLKPIPFSRPRRTVLQAGTVGMLGLPTLFQCGGASSLIAQERPSGTTSDAGGPGFGQAKRCLFLFMWGGPSHLDTFDMKPEMPAGIRGEFQPIPTAVPGLQICEHFERLAPIMDRVAVVRSLTHDDPAHLSSAHTTLTGQLPPVNKSDAEPPSERDTPHLGSVIARLRPAPHNLPGAVSMPWLAYHPAAPGGRAPGQSGGWLGRGADPFLIEGDPNAAGWSVPALKLLDNLDQQRLRSRQHLLNEIDHQRRNLDRAAAVVNRASQQQQAFELLASPEVREAFDLNQESDATRNTYGRHIHGQCVLLGRRLLEHGVPLVSINWHNDGVNFWDTHGNNFNRLKNDLIPPADQALTALLLDLESRGLLDTTLIVWVGEFGRRPVITENNAGREHHPFCYSGLLAGGGIRGGAIYGRSDRDGTYPLDNPTSPHDIAATVLHALGVPPSASLADSAGRPHRLYGGSPLTSLFG